MYSAPGSQINISDSFVFANEQNKHDLYTIKLSVKDGIGVTTFVTNDKTGVVMYTFQLEITLIDSWQI